MNPFFKRQEVYRVIDGERDHQDKKWGSIEKHPHEVGSWILIMESLLDDARKGWQSAQGNTAALDEIRKVVSVGVACIEQHGCPSREWIEEQKRKVILAARSPTEDAFGVR